MYRILSIYIFFIYLLPFTLLLNTNFMFEYYQVVVILSAFYLGGFLINVKNNIQPVDYKNFYVATDKLLISAAIVYFMVNAELVKDVFLHLVVYHDYGAWTLENTIKRYAGELDTGPLKKISTISFVMYMLFLGAYGFKSTSKKYYYLLVIILIIESSALARAGVIIGFIAYFSELLIRYNYYFSTIKIKKLIKIGMIIFLVISVIFFFSAYLRVQDQDNISDILVRKLGEYLLSTYAALMLWMQHTWYAETYGFATFAGAFKIIAGTKVESGFYGQIETSYGTTVIYTVIRGFLQDFGYTFTTLLFFISGIFIKYFTYRRMSIVGYFFIRIILFLILYMFYSPFIFATVFVAYFMAYFLLIFFHQKNYYVKVKNENMVF